MKTETFFIYNLIRVYDFLDILRYFNRIFFSSGQGFYKNHLNWQTNKVNSFFAQRVKKSEPKPSAGVRRSSAQWAVPSSDHNIVYSFCICYQQNFNIEKKNNKYKKIIYQWTKIYNLDNLSVSIVNSHCQDAPVGSWWLQLHLRIHSNIEISLLH